MKHNIFRIVILIVLALSGLYYSQSLPHDKKFSLQTGDFICRINNYLVYSHTEDDGEYPLYTLNSQNLITGNKEIIESQLSVGNCVKLSDSTLGYIKSDKLLIWNSNTKKRSEFIASKKFSNIIGLGFNPKNNSILFVEANYNTNKLRINVIDEHKNIIYNHQVMFNEMESEGIYPKIEATANYFVLMVQDNLYIIDFTKTKPNLKLISDSCNGFALNDTTGVLYYKFTTDERAEEYYLPFENRQAIKITNILNRNISNCAKSTLFTAVIANKLIPIYLICDTPFIFSELNWHPASDAVIYKDDNLIVKYPTSKQKTNYSSFEWNWQGF